MANLVLASKRELKSGMFWHVYRSNDNNKSEEFFFSANNPVKALRYAFLLRKRSGAILPKAIYTKLMADVEASKAQAEQEPSTAGAERSTRSRASSRAERTGKGF